MVWRFQFEADGIVRGVDGGLEVPLQDVVDLDREINGLLKSVDEFSVHLDGSETGEGSRDGCCDVISVNLPMNVVIIPEGFDDGITTLWTEVVTNLKER